ncbi:MAG: hypothetical protein ACYTFY_08465 [Planctomycetota bacterium]|jgi:hypothetical protein
MLLTLFAALLFIIPLTLVAINTLKKILNDSQREKLLYAFILLFFIGIAIGWWLGFEFEYKLNGTLRIAGFPFPVAFFKLEDGNWVDFIMPFPLLNAIIDMLVVTLFILAPFNIYLRLTRKQKKKEV